MFNIINKLPQALNLLLDGKTIVLKKYGIFSTNKITQQIKNLSKKGFIKICKVKSNE